MNRNVERGSKDINIYNGFALAIKTQVFICDKETHQGMILNYDRFASRTLAPRGGWIGGRQDSRNEALKLEYHTLVWPPEGHHLS